MPTLGRLWAGRIFGTNTGNVFLELGGTDDVITGTARLMDTVFGLSVYRVSGTFDDTLRLTAAPTQVEPGIDAGTIEVTAALTPEGNLRGEWRSSLGTAGTFEAYPHDGAAEAQRSAGTSQVPEQVYTSTVALGALRLYANDLWSLAQFIKKEFLIGRVVVTYEVRGNEVSKYLEDFQGEAPSLMELRRLKLAIQEPEAYGINRVVIVDLNAAGQNEVRVQGINESWVVGKCQAIARMLRPFENPLVTTFKKFGLTLNQLIFLAMLVVIPAISSMWSRAAFVAVVVLLMAALYQLHNRFIPSAALYFGQREPSFFQRLWPSLASWLIAASASLAAALAYYWLTRNAG